MWGVFAAAARSRLGELLGGSEGQRMMDEAAEFFREQGVKDVARFMDAVAVKVSPGW